MTTHQYRAVCSPSCFTEKGKGGVSSISLDMLEEDPLVYEVGGGNSLK